MIALYVDETSAEELDSVFAQTDPSVETEVDPFRCSACSARPAALGTAS